MKKKLYAYTEEESKALETSLKYLYDREKSQGIPRKRVTFKALRKQDPRNNLYWPQIKEFLQYGPRDGKDIAELLDVSMQTVSLCVRQYREEGKIFTTRKRSLRTNDRQNRSQYHHLFENRKVVHMTLKHYFLNKLLVKEGLVYKTMEIRMGSERYDILPATMHVGWVYTDQWGWINPCETELSLEGVFDALTDNPFVEFFASLQFKIYRVEMIEGFPTVKDVTQTGIQMVLDKCYSLDLQMPDWV